MIEFKAECGHTVRARDEDAGGAVRCTYCGRTVAVPDTADGNLDFLFRELPAQPPPEQRRRWPWRGRKRPTKAVTKPNEGIDVFAIVRRLCFFAALIAIVVVIGRKFVMPMLDEEGRARRMAGQMPVGAAADEGTTGDSGPAPEDSGRGLLSHRTGSGLFVASVPRGATAYVVEEAKAPKYGRIDQMSGVFSLHTDDTFRRLSDGTYMVEVALPWNDPGLNDPSLPAYSEYLNFRRSLEPASDAQRRQLQDEYFLPDEAVATFVADANDRVYFVRQYRGVSVRQGRSQGVRALFLPRLGKSEQRPFAIEPLLHGYIPPGKRYGFDERMVRSELVFYEVPASDQHALMEALARVGVIPYPGKDKRIRMFKIDLHDGAITMRVIREAGL